MWVAIAAVLVTVCVVALCVVAVGVWVFYRMCSTLRFGPDGIDVRLPRYRHPRRRVG